MSNIFQEVLSDAKGVEQRLLGPTIHIIRIFEHRVKSE